MKPEFLSDIDLAKAEHETGLPLALAYLGLMCECDCNGSFMWHLGVLRSQALPHRDVDFAAVIAALEGLDYVRRYEASDGSPYGLLTWFLRDQRPHNKEGPRYPPPPADLVPVWLRKHIRGLDPAGPQDRAARPGRAPGAPARGSLSDPLDPGLGPDPGLVPPSSPTGGKPPAAEGGIDISAFELANRHHFGRPLSSPERHVLTRFLAAGHHGPTLLELMPLHVDKAASSLIAYCVSAYHNGGGHVPPARKASAPAPLSAHIGFEPDEPVELSPEELAELAQRNRRLMAEMAQDGLAVGGAA